jgi:hypothetical protein
MTKDSGASHEHSQAASVSCSRYACNLARHKLHYRKDGQARCLRCALYNRALLRRSLRIAAFVGTIVTAINQGNVLLRG